MEATSGVARAALSSHRFFLRAGFAACSAFAWIFVLQFFYGTAIGHPHAIERAFEQTLLLYMLSQVVTILSAPIAARSLMKGTNRSMIWGVCAAAAACIIWGATLSVVASAHVQIGVILFALLMGIYRALYFAPYAIETELLTPSRATIPQEICIALMPAIAGYSLLVGTYAAQSLLFAGGIILLASLLPLMRVPETFEKYSWGYRQTFGEFFEPRYDALVKQSFFDGLQGTALLLIWPLTIFLLVGHSYKLVGIIFTISLLIAIPIRTYTARYIRSRTLLHATLAASTWALRLIVATPIGVVLVDTYASLGERRGNSYDRYALEQSADNGTYVDELTVLKEISLAVGRSAACVVAVLATSLYSLEVGLVTSFTIAGIASAYSMYRAARNESSIG